MDRAEISEDELDRLMERIRTEIAEQDCRVAADAAALISPAAPVTVAEGEPRRHKLKKLLRLEDEAFVDAVFRAVLGRTPDPNEAAYHRDRLRDGRLRKLGLIEELHGTKEGRKHGAVIKGLGPRRLASWIARIPVLGPVLMVLGSWARLPRLANNVRRIRHQTEQLNRTVDLLQSDLGRVAQRLEAVSAEVGRIGAGADRLFRGHPLDADQASELPRSRYDERIGTVAEQIAAEMRRLPRVIGLQLEAAVTGLAGELARSSGAVADPSRGPTPARLDDIARQIAGLQEQVSGLRAELGRELGPANCHSVEVEPGQK